MSYSSLVSVALILIYFFLNTGKCYQKEPSISFSLLSTCQETVIEAKECQHYFPIDTLKSYQNHMYKVRVKLYVMATNDVNIILVDKLKAPRTQYRAVIGGKFNTVSYLKKESTYTPYSSNNQKHITHPLWPTPIWVQHTIGGDIQISISNTSKPLLTLEASDFQLNYICMFAWGRPSRWFYNCNEEEDEIMKNAQECTKSGLFRTKNGVKLR